LKGVISGVSRKKTGMGVLSRGGETVSTGGERVIRWGPWFKLGGATLEKEGLKRREEGRLARR